MTTVTRPPRTRLPDAVRVPLACAAAVIATARQFPPARESEYLAAVGNIVSCLADGDAHGAAQYAAELAAKAGAP